MVAVPDERVDKLAEMYNPVKFTPATIEFVENRIEKNLSGFEKQVLNRYIQGESYVDIAQKLDSPVKSVDNAIQRIRKKAIKCLNDED